MAEFPISPEVVEAAKRADMDAIEQIARSGKRTVEPMGAAIRAALDKLGLREERVSHFVEDDAETESGHWVDGGRARLVSDYYDSDWRSVDGGVEVPFSLNSQELEVVPLARAVAAELKAANLTQRIIEQGRVLTDCDERRMAAEQRVHELERLLAATPACSCPYPYPSHADISRACPVHARAWETAEAERDALAEAIRTFLAIEYPDGEATEGFADAPAKALRAALAASVSKEEARDDA